MDKRVGARQAGDQLQTDRIQQLRGDRICPRPANDAKHRELGDVAEAGQLLQDLLGFDRQAGQPPNHEVHHIVGESLRVNAIEIPAPSRSVMIEGEQALFGERRQELKGEKRIATCLLMHQLRERRSELRFAAKRIRNQPREVFAGERRKSDLLYLRTGVLDGLKLARQRMRGIDFVIPISADQHQVLQIRSGQEILQQVERRGVEPLQVVEEQRQRMFRPCKHADESSEYQLEATLRLLRWKLRDLRLVSYDELQLGNKIDDQLTVRIQRVAKGVTPGSQVGLALGKKGPDEALKGLCERGIGDVPLVLIELAGREQAARRNEHLVQLIDDGGLAYT